LFEGTYNDGKSAARRDVRVSVMMSRLLIMENGGAAVDEWPIKGLRLIGEIYRSDQPVRISHAARGEALLTFKGQEILAALPSLSGRGGRWSWRRRIATWAGILVAILGIMFAALAAALPWAVDRLSNFVPPKVERALGAGVMTALGAQYATCRSPAGEEALAFLVGRLAAGRDLRNPIKIRVFRSKIPNAFTAPGGYIGVFEGLFRHARTPEDFAGVLAHEMGHAQLRHPEKSLLRQAGLALLFAALTGDPSALAASGGEFAKKMLHLSFTREAELESDREAVKMLNHAGMDSGGLAHFLERLQKSAPGLAEGGYFSTHPATGERIAAMQKTTRPGRPPMSEKEWNAIRRMCANTGSW
jgi:predicted Zn-dependent protease